VRAVRERAGVADVSHCGRIRIRGDGALDLLERACTADAPRQEDDTTMPTLLLDGEGQVLEASRLIRLPGFWVLVTSPAGRERVMAHLGGLAAEVGAKVDDQTLKTSMLAVSGPEAAAILDAVLPFKVSGLAEGAVRFGTLMIARYIAERTSETGEWGVRVQIPNMMAARAWRFVTEKAGRNALPPVGMAALRTLAEQAGALARSGDAAGHVDPLSAGMEGWVDWGHDFIGRDALEKRRSPR
jgi:aminomethyltransferase